MARDLGTSMDFCRQNGSNSKVQWICVDEKTWNIWGTYVRHMCSFAIKDGGVSKIKSLKPPLLGGMDPLGPSRLPFGDGPCGLVIEGKNIWKTHGFLVGFGSQFLAKPCGQTCRISEKLKICFTASLRCYQCASVKTSEDRGQLP